MNRKKHQSLQESLSISAAKSLNPANSASLSRPLFLARVAKFMLVLSMAWAMVSGVPNAALAEPFCPDPPPRTSCPVCGMFVVKYPSWIASVVYDDGHAHFFDGPKDLFKYWNNLPKYAPDHTKHQVKSICVTEYYKLKRIDAKQAWFVIGSEVLGPMGHELVPVASAEAAKEFLKDHQGIKILRFDQIDLQILKNLDKGIF